MFLAKHFVLFLVLILMAIGCYRCIHYDQNWNSDPFDAEVGCHALFLTPYIENGRIEEAQELATVPPMLPNVQSYSGYLTVNKTAGSNLFFWLFKSQTGNWEERPLVVWLQGGPGSSGLYGALKEIGPFSVHEGLKLVPREYSWNQKYNLVFFDQPVGTGFSFTRMDSGYATYDLPISLDLYEAIVQLYKLFPSLQKNKLFIAGRGYAAKYVPAIGLTIYRMNLVSSFKINLGGLMIGNGRADPTNQLNFSPLLFELGLIDKRTKDRLALKEDDTRAKIRAGHFRAALTAYRDIQADMREVTGLKTLYNFVDDGVKSYALANEFIAKSRVALHVGNCLFNGSWEALNAHLVDDEMKAIRRGIQILLTLDEFPIMFYSGQLDLDVPYASSVDFYNALEWPHAAEYRNASRCQFRVGEDVAGYYKTAGTFTEVLVRNAGHNVAVDQPKWAFELLDRFISNSRSFKCE